MKYLAIFRANGLQTAIDFNNASDAEKYIKTCAAAAKTKALKSTESNSYILTVNNQEITVEVQKIDAKLSYQLANHQNGATETASYATRASGVKAAKAILDQLDFEASTTENQLGHWTANNDQVKAEIKLSLTLETTDGASEICRYDAIEPKYFCTHLDAVQNDHATQAVASQTAQLADARKTGWKNLAIGLAIAAAGGLLTLVSYTNTKPGGSYRIYTGLIVVGIIDALVGLYYVIRPKSALKTPKEPKK